MGAIAATALPLRDVYAKGRFAPAAVQRDFRWNKDEFRALIDDLLRAFVEAGLDEPRPSDADPDGDSGPDDTDVGEAAPLRRPDYFMGSIVLMEEAPGAFLIFDGQQRLTTCTALLSVLRDRCTDPALRAELDACINTADGRGRLDLKLRDHTLSYDVQRAGATLAYFRHEDSDSLTDAGLRLRSAVILFRGVIDGRGDDAARWSDERLHRFARYVLDDVQVVCITIADERLANLAFETTNFRGLRLDQGDALKSKIIDTLGADDPGALEAAAVWLDLQRDFGVHDFERFLTVVDFTERRAWQGPTKFNDLFEHLRKRHGARLGAWVTGRLTDYASAYRAITQHERHATVRGADLYLRRLSLLPYREWMALALHARQTMTDDAWQAFAPALERACFAILFAGYSSQDRAGIFAKALWGMRQGNDVFADGAPFHFRPGAVDKIRQFLSGPLDENDKSVLHATVRWLEALHWSGDLSSAPLNPDLTVEHVLPLRPDAIWQNKFPDRAARERLARMIGNLCLLPYTQNTSAAGNKQFAQKAQILRDVGRQLHLTHDAGAQPDWTPAIVEERNARLAAKAWAALGLPGSP